MSESKSISSFKDLHVYQESYQNMLVAFQEILPKLPLHEQYDLKVQLRRSVKAIPRLIAEGYAKRHQKLGFQKYIDDAMAECNETVVGLCQCRDLYNSNMDVNVCTKLIDGYDKTGRQLYRLREAWSRFSKNNR